MYLLDPRLGRRRRALARDKAVKVARQLARDANLALRDLAHRAQGVVAESRRAFRHDHADDHTIEQRVRAQLGRHVAHAHGVHVRSAGGIVILSGPVTADERDDLITAVRKVPGVCGISNNLFVTDRGGASGGAAHAHPHRPHRPHRRQTLTPADRGVSTLAGAGLATRGLSNGSLPGVLLSLYGGALMWRGMNAAPGRRRDAGKGGVMIEVRKTIDIGADVGEVFGFFSNYDNFPLFMHNVRGVRDFGDGRSHWVVAGPAGVNVEWDAVITDFVPHERIAWRSVGGGTVENSGEIRFLENYGGGTHVDVRLRYHPPGGAFGHAVATMFGADPKSEMDADLARLKTLIESARFPHDAAKHASIAGSPPAP
jgi:uncharacterized membrane protein